MKLTNLISFLLLLMAMTSCANYVAKVHRDLDRDLMRQSGVTPPDNFESFRNPQAFHQNARMQAPQQGHMMPSSQFQQGLSSENVRNVAPSVQRQYIPQQQANRRVRANDLNDNDNRGSLWVNNGEPISLFSNTRQKGQGDIVLVNVHKHLKNEITAELKRAFPDPPPPRSQQNAGEAAAATAEARDPANEVADDDEKVYDRISTVIVEEINRDHVLLRGRKNLLYKNRRRLVEIQALVNRRDLANADSVRSDSIIESTINVLR